MKPKLTFGRYIITLLLTISICAALCLSTAQKVSECESILTNKETAILSLTEQVDIIDADNTELSAQLDTLTTENAELKQDITWLRYTNDQRATTIEMLTNVLKDTREADTEVQQTKVPEAQKTNRSADRPRYDLTDSERELVERVVMAESGGECYEGQVLVCQCILNACEINGIRPAEAIKRYAYAKGRPEASDSVKRAVQAVFDKGEKVESEPIIYFYAPKMVKSEFHESQRFIRETGGHRFFAGR